MPEWRSDSLDIIDGTAVDVSGSPPPLPYSAVSWRQLAVFVLDGSPSMEWDFQEADESLPGMPVRSKAAAVDAAMKDLINSMKDRPSASNFKFGFVDFDSRLIHAKEPADLTTLPHGASYDPTRAEHGARVGGTSIFVGIEAAAAQVTNFLRPASAADDVEQTAVVVVLSDGECSDPQRTLAAAAQLRANPRVTLAAGLFGTRGSDNAGTRILQAIASLPSLYDVVYSAHQLREFLHRSVTQTGLAARAQP
jgi:uncharacterized protein YegL